MFSGLGLRPATALQALERLCAQRAGSDAASGARCLGRSSRDTEVESAVPVLNWLSQTALAGFCETQPQRVALLPSAIGANAPLARGV